MYGRIGQEATKKTPKMCKAYVVAAARIRKTARLLVAALDRRDDDAINLYGEQLKKEIDPLVPALLATYDKAALEKMWSEVEGALYRQRDVDTPAFLRQLEACPKPVHLAVALRPGDMMPSQPLRRPTVLLARYVENKDLVLGSNRSPTSQVLDTIGSKIVALGAATVGDAFGNVDTLPDHATPLYILRQTQNFLNSSKDSHNSLFWSRSGTVAALDPITGDILFRTDRLDSGHPSIDAAYIQRHALDVEATGAYRCLCQLADADRGALLAAAAEEASSRNEHARDVEQRLDEAYASGICANVVAFLYQANYAERDGRAFEDRRALELLFASMGVPCLPLTEGEGGISTSTPISDLDRHLYRVLPPHLRVNRRRVVVVCPKRHVYPEDASLGHSIAKHLARNCRVFNETVAGAASADVTILEDLDSVRLDEYKAFVKVDEAFLTKWRFAYPQGSKPKVMFNAAAGFKSKADVAREAAEKRKAELGAVVAPGDFRSKNQDARKKEAFDFESYLKPGGVWSLARLKELKLDFETQIGRYHALPPKAKIPKDLFNYRGHREKSRNNLAEVLECKKFKSDGRGPAGVMGDYVGELDKKIKELDASAAG